MLHCSCSNMPPDAVSAAAAAAVTTIAAARVSRGLDRSSVELSSPKANNMHRAW